MIPFSENLHYLDPGTGSYLFLALLVQELLLESTLKFKIFHTFSSKKS